MNLEPTPCIPHIPPRDIPPPDRAQIGYGGMNARRRRKPEITTMHLLTRRLFVVKVSTLKSHLLLCSMSIKMTRADAYT